MYYLPAPKPKLTFLSLFTGVGGFDLGLERAGMTCLGMCEIDPNCQIVLRHRWPDVYLYQDVKNIRGDEFSERLSAVDLICGGFPCQDLSRGNQQHEGLAGERSGLWFEYLRVINHARPKWVVIENVPGLLTNDGGRDFATILRGLGQCGYDVAWRILDSQYFGVPQRRERVFIVAGTGTQRRHPARVLFEREGSTGNAQRKPHGQTATSGLYAESPCWWNGRGISQTLDRVLYKKQTMPEKQRFPAVTVPAWIECPDCGDFWCVIHGCHAYDCSCPSIDTWAEYGVYPYDAGALRWLTPLEAERLQGFPDHWTDVNGMSDSARYRMMGNAVTVNVAEWLGRRIMEAT